MQSLLKLSDTELQIYIYIYIHMYIYIFTVGEVIVASGVSLMFGGVFQVFI